jgi:MFS family permease
VTAISGVTTLADGILQFVSQIAPYFANTQGSSDAEAGWMLVLVSIGNALGSLIAGRVIKRSDFYFSLPDQSLLIERTSRFGSYKRLSLSSLIISIAISFAILFQWTNPMSVLSRFLR